MTKPKAAFVRINKDFLLVTSFIRGMIAMTDPDQDFIFNEVDILQKNLEEEMKKRYGYKNKKSIYKDMSFLSLEQDASFIIIAPLHQDSLGGYSGISLPDNSPLEFKYDKNISDEELGKAIRQALTYCTSIYR